MRRSARLIKQEVSPTTSRFFQSVSDSQQKLSEAARASAEEQETKSPGPRRKKIKVEKVEVKIEDNEVKGGHSEVEVPNRPSPPKNFWPIYDEVKKMRAKVIAPVDTMGCHNIPTRISGLQEGLVFRFQLLITLMLSSQTKDEVNHQVMADMQKAFLAKGYEDGVCLQAMLDVSEFDLDKMIYRVGFHNRKAKYIKQTAEILREKHGGDIPKDIDSITAFPGVGPKMGFLLLQGAWNITTGIGVDVHMFRLANMWGWVPKTKSPTPEQTRAAFESWLPEEYWQEINPTLVGFGQVVCLPRGPRCDLCTLATKKMCPGVDRKLLNKVAKEKALYETLGGDQNPNLKLRSPKKSRGDISRLMLPDIEDLV
ncbi:unnamed protein product [Kuraishia capsulata CBS 1993]|uniref:Endonuclease III homolog n=1 Tax=Kuraishia capsulata CBS 1993 TaxID=1382522 RepID=W6MS21_9ASCO|nr:uncharacterized protein KUCA_T00005574001 [Kuraishia capsulata CBS 1993]CDK29581.1 unnamed protein product [Kuraishia capsulata CBS 1993]